MVALYGKTSRTYSSNAIMHFHRNVSINRNIANVKSVHFTCKFSNFLAWTQMKWNEMIFHFSVGTKTFLELIFQLILRHLLRGYASVEFFAAHISQPLRYEYPNCGFYGMHLINIAKIPFHNLILVTARGIIIIPVWIFWPTINVKGVCMYVV